MANEHELIKQLVEEADRLADALNTPRIDMAEAVALVNGWYKGRLRVKALSNTAGATASTPVSSAATPRDWWFATGKDVRRQQ